MTPASEPVSAQPSPVVEAAQDVARHSAELKKELSLPDLVLTQILYITGLGWVGTAAKLGSAHAFFWIPAALLFYIPSAIVVIHLAREMPLEGGLYQWAKLRWGPMTGFLVAWNLAFYSVLLISEMGMITANNLAYAAGPKGAWLGDSKVVIMILCSVFALGPMWVAIRGLSLGKWIHNLGAVTLIALFVAMVIFALPHWFSGHAATRPFALAIPAISILNLNILGKMSFGAFSGCEGIAVFSGECRDPNSARVVRKSVMIAAPLVAGLFTLGTACILVFCAPNALDLVSPVAQNLSLGARSLGIAGPVVPLAMLLMLLPRIGAATIILNMVSRLPMVAGWDHLLPAWFTKLHPKHRTPVGSIIFVGIMVLVFSVAANLGVGSQEAFQLLNNGSGIAYALTYLVMFAIPLAARGPKPPPLIVRLAAFSGLMMTLLYVVLSVWPIIDVPNARGFALKLALVIAAANCLGVLIYWRGTVRRSQNAGYCEANELQIEAAPPQA